MNRYLTLVAAAAASFAMVDAAHARMRVIDGGNVSACSVQDVFGAMPTDGAISMSIGTYDSGACGAATVNGFSVNIGGNFYSTLFVNENGIVSFGSAISDAPSTALSALTAPAFAPFFANGAILDNASLLYGYTDASVGFPDSFWLTWDAFIPEGAGAGAPANIFQLGIVDLGGGDFDLIFNYEAINWDDASIGAQAGLTDGLGNAFLLSGAGVAGAYLGSDDTSSGASVCTSANPATALACNKINDGSQAIGGVDFNTGLPSNGYYLFKFRDGVLQTAEVPLPGAAGLFLVGAIALGTRRRANR